MHMSFWAGYNVEELLFPSLSLSSVLGLVGTCLVIALLAVGYELLSFGLARVKLHSSSLKPRSPPCTQDGATLLNPSSSTAKQRWAWFSMELAIYTVELVLGYILMLVVMTYNVYFLVAVLVGAAVGHVFMGTRIAAVRLKACRIRPPCSTCTSTRDPNTSSMSQESSGSNNITETEIESNDLEKTTSPKNSNIPV